MTLSGWPRHRAAGGCHSQRRTGLFAAVPLAVVLLAAFLWSAVGPSGFAGAPAADAAAKALVDARLDESANDPALRTPFVADIRQLGASWVRVGVAWSRLELEEGSYDAAEIARLDGIVDDLRAADMKVLLTVHDAPHWSQDTSYPGNPGVAYPIRTDALDDFGRLGEYLAAHFSGRVRAMEVWNEPNLWTFLYPQRTADDPYFGARTYLRMLKSFSAGVRRGDPDVLVVAGATAPVGLNDRYRTSPQRFASFLKSHGAAAYFDAYSHHPYTPGGSVNHSPDEPPNDPNTTVTLYNLPTLLRLFPTKPFYLTEYGYNTEPSLMFGGFAVSEAAQANYLRAAYRRAGRYPQVKALFWYLVTDSRPVGLPAERGVYTGLRRSDGSRKPSWFVFAGGNRVSLLAPERARRGSLITLSGRVTCASIGPVAGRSLSVQARRLGTSRWYPQATVISDADGRYGARLTFRYATQYRVRWSVVSTSLVRTVRVR
ncbi:MAG: cellulase family glycosylhydrolase [Thermoleophilia bacterium]